MPVAGPIVPPEMKTWMALKAGKNESYSSRCYLVEMSMKVIDHDFTVEILSIPPPSLGNQRRFDKNYGDFAHDIEGGPPRATKRPCSISVSFTDSKPGGLRAVLSSCGSNILGNNAKSNKTFGIPECRNIIEYQDAFDVGQMLKSLL